jgi:hypothetical protein
MDNVEQILETNMSLNSTPIMGYGLSALLIARARSGAELDRDSECIGQ